MPTKLAALTAGEMRLTVSQGGDETVGYQIFVNDSQGAWRAVSADASPLISGSSFKLRASQIRRVDDHRIDLAGHTTEKVPWKATILADARNGWFIFEIEVNSPSDLQLKMHNGFEPEMVLDLGPLPPYERGDHVWFMTQITNPTKWNDDAYGNDFPATYYFDPYKNAEIMLFFDMTSMGWMSKRNVARFLNYRCGFRRRYEPEPAGELGLYATGSSGNIFPAGPQRFRYFVTARPRTGLVDEREAIRLLVERCLPLLPQRSPWPANATSWHDFAGHCASDLMTTGCCWRESDQGQEFLLNYVDGFSPAWKEAIEARGNVFDMIKPCFDAAVWLAHPLAVLGEIDRRKPIPELYDRVCRMIDRAVEAGQTPYAPVSGDTASGTWQHLFILEELFQLARLRKNQSHIDRVIEEVNSVVIPLAKRHSYLFPLSFNRRTIERVGAGDAHAVLGAYASFMLDLHETTADARYLEEATISIRILHRLPVNAIHQEVFLLAMGVSAAHCLAVISTSSEFEEIYRYLLAQTLRMMYWYADTTSRQSRKISTLGMFQACATISYPAIFENVEVLARISSTFRKFVPSPPLLRIFDHARRNNFYFFPRCFDAGREVALKYVPFENIPILEGPASGSVGQEIYGSGWVFRAALMWESLGHAENRDVMVMNLDSFSHGRTSPTFIVFNGTAERQQTEIILPCSRSRAEFATAETPEKLQTAGFTKGPLRLDLPPEATVYVRAAGCEKK